MHARILGILALLALAGCHSDPMPDSAYYNRGGPEQLLDVSSEVVSLSINSSTEMKDLSRWVNKDKPSRAELYCKQGETRCMEAQKLLDLHGVPSATVPSADNMVALVYERVVARDCNQRFTDYHTHNWTSAPEYGCSVAANMVQHVSDKQQFVSPAVMPDPRATSAVNMYNNANRAQAAQQQQQQSYDLQQSTLSQAATTGSSQ